MQHYKGAPKMRAACPVPAMAWWAELHQIFSIQNWRQGGKKEPMTLEGVITHQGLGDLISCEGGHNPYSAVTRGAGGGREGGQLATQEKQL